MALSEKWEEISPWGRSTREDGTLSLSHSSETRLDEQNLPRAPSAVHPYTHLPASNTYARSPESEARNVHVT